MPSLKFDGLADNVGKGHDDWVNASPYWSNDDREMSRAADILWKADQVLAEGKKLSLNAKKRREAAGKRKGPLNPKNRPKAQQNYGDDNIKKPWTDKAELNTKPMQPGMWPGVKRKGEK